LFMCRSDQLLDSRYGTASTNVSESSKHESEDFWSPFSILLFPQLLLMARSQNHEAPYCNAHSGKSALSYFLRDRVCLVDRVPHVLVLLLSKFNNSLSSLFSASSICTRWTNKQHCAHEDKRDQRRRSQS